MFGNIGKMMKFIGEMKTRLPEMQKKLDETTYQAATGGGAVRASVTGKMRIVDVKLDKDLLADANIEMVEDLIKAAVAAAQEKAAKAAKAAMMELTGGANIPGLDAMLG